MSGAITLSLAGDGYQAYLVIDSVANESSSGGVRIAEEVPLEEVQALAREMSLKYALFRLPRGGAKMGISMSPALAAAEKLRLLTEIGRKLGPIIRTGVYNPGMDMNCGPEELRAIYAGAGVTLGRVTDTSYFTALSVENALEACYEESGASGRWTIAVEGFGRVAGHLAERLAADRYRIVALSTLCGAVRSPDGWDGKRLAAQRAEAGDRVVGRVGGEAIESEDLLLAPVDVLLPSTRTWVITRRLAERIRARVIVPIANAPYEEGAVACLRAKGVLCLPGFLTNAGGVFGSTLFDTGVAVDEVEQLIERQYRPAVRQILRRSSELGIPPVELAQRVATGELEARSQRPGPSGKVAKLWRRLARRLPTVLGRRVARRNFMGNMHALRSDVEALTR